MGLKLPTFLGNSEERPMPENLPAIPPQRPSARQKSEIAAQAAQYVDELQTALEGADRDIVTLRNQVDLLQQRCAMLADENERFQNQRDYYRDRNRQIMTSWDNAVALLLTVMKEGDAHAAVERAEDAITEAIQPANPPPVSEFAPQPKPVRKREDPRVKAALEATERAIMNPPPPGPDFPNPADKD